jgi:signal transduction histidine kinase/FixJ family two-component response regulator
MGHPLAYAYLIAFVGMTVLATLLAVSASPEKNRWLRSSLVALLAGWNLADFLSSLAVSSSQLWALARVFAPVWAAVPYALLLTAVMHTRWPRWTQPLWVRILLSLPGLVCVYLVHAGLLYREFLPASVNASFFQSRSTSWQAFVMGYVLTYAALSVAVLLGAARQQSNPQFRATGMVLLRALAPAAGVGVITNGSLSPFGVDFPYLGSILCSIVAAIVGIGTLRRDLFTTTSQFHRELEAARNELSRRDEVLSALPLGVAIVEPDSQQVLYANELFRSLSALGAEGLSSTFRSAFHGASKGDPSAPCELAVMADGRKFSLLLTRHGVHYGGRPLDLLILRDVTATRKLEHEVAKQRESLAHVQQMEAVGRLSAGIAHDFNNQLSVIVTNATAMLETSDGDPRYRTDLEEIISAVERGRRLTSQLLAFGRKQAPRPEVVDVNEVLRHLERVLQRLVGSSIVLAVRPATLPALVRIDRFQLEQVVLALATNAADAMPDGGTLTFEVFQAARGEVVVSARDTGCGIAPEIIDRVFEPFFSTKGKAGTGLGLASAYSYTRSAGAHIEVQSRVGDGTEFILRFPAVAIDTAVREEAVDATPQPAASAITVLLVDDEEGVRRGFSRLLRRRGYHVLEASSAREAMALFDDGPIDILVTDIAMPDTDGRELAAALREKRRDLPVLFISGQFRDPDVPRDRAVAFLAKPFAPEDLCAKLEDLVAADTQRTRFTQSVRASASCTVRTSSASR